MVVIDADGQHPPSAIPALVAAGADAELVVGDRFDDFGSMPYHRRLANRTTRRLFQLFTGREVRDTQSGMRLPAAAPSTFCPMAATRPRHGICARCSMPASPVAWVPIPAIYENEGSFRAGGTRYGFFGDRATALTAHAAAMPTAMPSSVPAVTSST